MVALELGELKQGDRSHDAIHAVADKVESEHGITVRNMSKRDLEAEIGRFMEVYNSAWEKNWGFVPITDEEVRFQAKNLKQILDERWTFIAERDGETARRGPHPARHQPGDEEDERPPAPVRLAALPARQGARSTGSASSRSGSSPSTSTPASRRRFYVRHVETARGHAVRRPGTRAGSSRPTSR